MGHALADSLPLDGQATGACARRRWRCVHGTPKAMLHVVLPVAALSRSDFLFAILLSFGLHGEHLTIFDISTHQPAAQAT